MVQNHSSKKDLFKNVLIQNPFSQDLIDCAPRPWVKFLIAHFVFCDAYSS